MKGNAWIPKAILVDCQNELQRRVPGLQVRELEIFGAASFLLTGGFYSVGLSWPVISDSSAWSDCCRLLSSSFSLCG